jgi:hypothetical protein
MEIWNYKKQETEFEQTTYNQSLKLCFNDVNNLKLTNNDILLVSYVLKSLMETLLWRDKDRPIITYRYDNEHSIYVNNNKLRIENYDYNHQDNEEWVESQKNVFLNLDSNPKPDLYPDIWKSKESIRNYLNGKFSSGKIIGDNDIIYMGILKNHITNIGSVIYFHIDELKSKNAIYKYALTNNENKSLHPELFLLKLVNNDMKEFELAKQVIDNHIKIAIDNTGTKNTYREFQTIIEGNLSDETCNEIIKYYKNNGWKYVECESSKRFNERTKNEYNLDRRYYRTGVLLKNFIKNNLQT